MRFGTKISIAFIILLSLTYGIGGSILIFASTSRSLDRAQESASSSHRLILYALSAVGGSSQREDYNELVSTLAQLETKDGQSRVLIRLSDDDRIIFQSQNSGHFLDAPENSAAADKTIYQVFRNDGEYLVQITSILLFHSNILHFESIHNLTPVYEARAAQNSIYKQIFIVVVIAGALLSWGLAHFMTLPLRKLSKVTKTIAHGDLSCRADISGGDEISVLASDINHMTDKLEENITALKNTMSRQEEFMGGFAHELKTPMTSIIGYADLLRSYPMSDDDKRDAANYIFTESKRLEILSLKLLDLIVLKRRDFVLAHGNIASVVKDVAVMLRPLLLKQKITLRCRCGDTLIEMEADLIKSLLLNLIDNARKAIDGGGDILVEAFPSNGGCLIRITDNGRGIPEDDLAHLTDAFYRVDKSRSRAQGGVGLGLALCSEIVSLHNGSISFESELGKGTRITVTLKGGGEIEKV